MDNAFIIGTALTVLFGIPGYLALKKESTTRIIFIEVDKINLYDKVVKSFKDLKITYKGNSIKHSMFLLRGFFFCVGRKDIVKNNIVKDVSVDLTENSYWHECKIISSSKDLDANLDINKNEVELSVPLFKNEDFLYMEAIGESQDGEYEVNHRIANIPKVKVKKFEKLTSTIGSMLFAFLLIIGGLIFVFAFKPYKTEPFLLENEFLNSKDSVLVYDSIPFNEKVDNNILTLSNQFRDSAAKEHNQFYFFSHEFSKKYKVSDEYYVRYFLYDRKSPRNIIVFSILISLITLVSFILSIREFFRFKRLFFLMRKEIQKDSNKRKEETAPQVY